MDFLSKLGRRPGGRWIGLCLFAAAFLLVALLPGCGSSGSSWTGGAYPEDKQNVVFNFTDGQGGYNVPAGTKQVRFTGQDGTRHVLYEATRDFAATITLTDVPVKTTGFVLEYLDANGQLLGLCPIKSELSLYEATNINVPPVQPLANVIESSIIEPDEIPALGINQDETFQAILILEGGLQADVTNYVTATPQDNTIVKVEGNKVVGLAAGTTEVQLSLLDYTFPTPIKVTVDPGNVVTGIRIKPGEDVLTLGESLQLTAWADYSQGEDVQLDAAQVEWSFEPADAKVTLTPGPDAGKAVATLESAKGATVGVVTVKAIATIQVGEETKSMEATAAITLTDATVVSIEIKRTDSAPAGLTNEQIYSSGEGSTAQFTATLHYSDGTSKENNDGVTWNSSAEETAAFQNSTPGLLQGVKASAIPVTVKATRGMVESNTIEITVVNPGIDVLAFNFEDINAVVGVPYSGIKIEATYGNQETQNVSGQPETKLSLVAESGEPLEGYATFEIGSDGQSVTMNPLKATDTTVYLKVEHDEYQGAVSRIPVTIINDGYNILMLTFIDDVGREYAINAFNAPSTATVATSQNYRIGLPIGRTYTMKIMGRLHSEGEDAPLRDITGNYIFSDSIPWDAAVPDEDKTITAPVVEFEQQGEAPAEPTLVRSYPISVLNKVFDREQGVWGWSETPQIGSWDFADDIGWSDGEEFLAEGSDPDALVADASFGLGGEKDGSVIVAIRSKVPGESDGGPTTPIFKTDGQPYIGDMRVVVYPVKPAVDKLGMSNIIPRGENWKPSASATYSDMIRVGDDETPRIVSLTEIKPDEMATKVGFSLDTTSLQNVDWITSKEMTEDGYTSIKNTDDIPEATKKIGQTAAMIIYYSEATHENVEHSGIRAGSKWYSFHADKADGSITLGPPNIKSANVVIQYADGREMTPVVGTKGGNDETYELQRGEQFVFYLNEVVLSDDTPNPNPLKTGARYDIIGTSEDRVVILEDRPGTTKPEVPYVVKSEQDLPVDATNSVTLTPESAAYFNASSWIKRIIVKLID